MKRFVHRHQPVPVLRMIPIAGLGAALAVIILGALTHYGSLPLMIAPFGASCVLLFSAHSSPLSQPINVVGGHLVSAVVGMLFHTLWPDSFMVAGLAAGVALMAMMALRVVHPPAGATALIGYASTAGWMFVLFPVFIGSVLMVGLALVYHQVSETQYPLHPPK